ncbi:hypothetical protein SAMN05444285_11969 [Draconibacterium orientale]|uniref:Uncharacterized protein n=1 Tax=Draconibacterium orientale TaxID=1168034 RepID=A0A1I0GC76_9BACT|nr:hypothetical protein SAMN05444285_11969 [Draconibacterium orientale]
MLRLLYYVPVLKVDGRKTKSFNASFSRDLSNLFLQFDDSVAVTRLTVK